MQNKKAFTLVEIIIVLSIIMLLGVVAMSYQGASNQNAQNTRTVGDLGTLNNSLASYLEETKSLPDPQGNKNYYNYGSEYSHETDTFGVHGFATQNLLPKKYLNYLPLDPRTNQYYAYGKTIDKNFYEVAGVLNIDGKYTTKLTGNYTAENGPYSLIREYNGPNFISDKSTNSFPYNPEEKLLVAKINYISGTVTINGNSTNILDHILTQGDIIETSSSSTATIFFSDGSQSVLSENSKLVLEEMKFKQEDNLLTRIKLSLESGILWTKATNLNSDSEKSDFEVSTQDTTAAVRGTIFGISYIGGTTSVTVKKGTVEIFNRINENSRTHLNYTTEGNSYNSTLIQPDFNITTEIPNNTRTGAILETTKDLLTEYQSKNPEETVVPRVEPVVTCTASESTVSFFKTKITCNAGISTTTYSCTDTINFELNGNNTDCIAKSCDIGNNADSHMVYGTMNSGTCEKEITINTSLLLVHYYIKDDVKIYLFKSGIPSIFYIKLKKGEDRRTSDNTSSFEVSNSEKITISKNDKKYCIKDTFCMTIN